MGTTVAVKRERASTMERVSYDCYERRTMHSRTLLSVAIGAALGVAFPSLLYANDDRSGTGNGDLRSSQRDIRQDSRDVRGDWRDTWRADARDVSDPNRWRETWRSENHGFWQSDRDIWPRDWREAIR